jgi:hypothetical protein
MERSRKMKIRRTLTYFQSAFELIVRVQLARAADALAAVDHRKAEAHLLAVRDDRVTNQDSCAGRSRQV